MSVTTVSPSRPPQEGWRFSLVWLIPGGLLFAGILAFATLQPLKVLPRIALSPGFAFTDQTGQRLTSEDLRGQLVVYNFTYTGCIAPCPETGSAMRALQAHLSQIDTRGLPVKLVTIAFDPTHDTMEQLRTYGAAQEADPATWSIVSGPAAQLKNVIGGGFGVYYDQLADGTFVFDPTFALVDGAGILRAKYRTASLDMVVIQRDLELIASEAERSQGALRFAYEAAHLFLCYPR